MWVALASCCSLRGDKARVLWKCVVHALLWVIWQKRMVESLKKDMGKKLIAYGIESNS